MFFPNEDPIGRRVTLGISGGTFSIVGVVGAIKNANLAAPPPPHIYYLGPQMPVPVATVIIKTAGDPLALTSAIRHEILALDPDMPVAPQSMEQIMAESLGRERFAVWLIPLPFGGTGLGTEGTIACDDREAPSWNTSDQ